jgi:hypothetical protein
MYILVKILNKFDKFEDKNVSKRWIQDNIVTPINNKINIAPIVDTFLGERTSIKDSLGHSLIKFPFNENKEIREKIWDLYSKWKPNFLPLKEDIENWYSVIWNSCYKLELVDFATEIQQNSNLGNLKNTFCDGVNVYSWLNEYFNLLEIEGKFIKTISSSNLIFPNQYGNFTIKTNLNIPINLDSELLDISENLGYNFRNLLLLDGIVVSSYLIPNSTTNLEVSTKIYQLLQEKGILSGEKDSSTKKVRSSLLIWFKNNKEKANKYFNELFKNQHKLLDEDEVVQNIEKGIEIDNILEEFSLQNINSLREILIKTNTQKRELSQQDLLIYGITSQQSLENAFLNNKEFSRLFLHTSVPSYDMFTYVQQLIERSRNNIISRLKSIPIYDCSNLVIASGTILTGIRKNGTEIQVVARPSDGHQVIIYYYDEIEALTDNAELWIDNGYETPNQLTLGRIIKKSGINRIPV